MTSFLRDNDLAATCGLRRPELLPDFDRAYLLFHRGDSSCRSLAVYFFSSSCHHGGYRNLQGT